MELVVFPFDHIDAGSDDRDGYDGLRDAARKEPEEVLGAFGKAQDGQQVPEKCAGADIPQDADSKEDKACGQEPAVFLNGKAV